MMRFSLGVDRALGAAGAVARKTADVHRAGLEPRHERAGCRRNGGGVGLRRC